MAKQKARISLKQVMINKSNSNMVLIAALAAFVAVFCLVASKSLVDQMMYQNKVISAKKQTRDLLGANLEATTALVSQYKTFQSKEINILGGNSQATGGNNGDNASLITDSLPASYDFPALANSIERMVVNDSLNIDSIVGIDDEVQQQTNGSAANPEPVGIPFEVKASGNYQNVQKLIQDFQRSIRPFVVKKITLGGSSAQNQSITTVKIEAQTYYQPGKELKITKEVIAK